MNNHLRGKLPESAIFNSLALSVILGVLSACAPMPPYPERHKSSGDPAYDFYRFSVDNYYELNYKADYQSNFANINAAALKSYATTTGNRLHNWSDVLVKFQHTEKYSATFISTTIAGLLLDRKNRIIVSSKGNIDPIANVNVAFSRPDEVNPAYIAGKILYHDKLSDLTFIQVDSIPSQQPDAIAYFTDYKQAPKIQYLPFTKTTTSKQADVIDRRCHITDSGCTAIKTNLFGISAKTNANIQFGSGVYDAYGYLVGMILYRYEKPGQENLWMVKDIYEILWIYKQYLLFGNSHPYWGGVLIQNVSTELAEAFGLPNTSGALIAKVMDNSPAQRAGLKVGDIIQAVNKLPVRNASHYLHLFHEPYNENEVQLTVNRMGTPHTIILDRGRTRTLAPIPVKDGFTDSRKIPEP